MVSSIYCIGVRGNKIGFYRAYKTKSDAQDAAKNVRRAKHGRANVTVKHIKRFFSDGRSAWGVYEYPKEKTH
jgi:hypothetical protein